MVVGFKLIQFLNLVPNNGGRISCSETTDNIWTVSFCVNQKYFLYQLYVLNSELNFFMFFISDMLDNSSITYYYTIAIFSKIVGCGLKLLQLNLVDMVWRLLLFICKMAGTHQGEDDWKEHEAVEEAKDNHEKEHFEEDNKRIIV